MGEGDGRQDATEIAGETPAVQRGDHRQDADGTSEEDAGGTPALRGGKGANI